MNTKHAVLLLLLLANAAMAATVKPEVAIKAGKLCILAPPAAERCLFKNEWNDLLKAMQEYMHEHDGELKKGKSNE